MNRSSAILALCINIIVSYSFLPLVAHSNENVRQLNDTGINYGGNYPKGISPNCTAKILMGSIEPAEARSYSTQQDCSTGASALTTSQEQSVFSYLKVGSDGSKLPADAKQWQCVIDEISGLMWEVKHRDEANKNLHIFSDKFTWYNSDPKSNGGNIGDWNRHGKHCFGYVEKSPRSYCHVEQFVSRVNKQELCGFSDWRLPTRAELTSLIHFGEFQPAINLDYFPNTLANFYWTLSPVVGRQIEAWSINFEFGFSSPLRKTDPRPARLVRYVKGNK